MRTAEDDLSQEELLELLGPRRSDDDASVDHGRIEPSVMIHSSRQGGVASKLDLSEDENDDFETDPKPSTSAAAAAAKTRAGSKRSAKTEDGIQIDLTSLAHNAAKESSDVYRSTNKARVRNASSSSEGSDFESVDGDSDGPPTAKRSKPDDDLFGDVFNNEEEVSKLDGILARGDQSKESAAQSVLEAAAGADSVEEVFAQVSKKARKFESSGGSKDDNKRQLSPTPSRGEKTKNADGAGGNDGNLASTMKESNHLFLKIASKWAAEEGKPSPRPDPEQESPNAASSKDKEQGNELIRKLEQERKALAEEMHRREDEDRLMKIKVSPYYHPEILKT